MSTTPNFERIDAVLAKCKSDPTYNQESCWVCCFGGFAIKLFGDNTTALGGRQDEAARVLNLVDNKEKDMLFGWRFSLQEIEENIKKLKERYGYVKPTTDNSKEEFLKEIAQMNFAFEQTEAVYEKYYAAGNSYVPPIVSKIKEFFRGKNPTVKEVADKLKQLLEQENIVTLKCNGMLANTFDAINGTSTVEVNIKDVISLTKGATKLI